MVSLEDSDGEPKIPASAFQLIKVDTESSWFFT
jgi:hypothetical protein